MKEEKLQQRCTVLKGDALVMLSKLESESVHAVITDPPYGLTKSLDVEEMLAAWLAKETFVSDLNGYGGAEWDNSVPGPELWRETYRLLVPGGFVLAFAAARTIDLTTLALRLAGFDIRDLIHWVYAPGRPSRDQGRVALELGDADLATSAAGLRPTLRPGHEPIVVARKPFDESSTTLLDNLYDFGVGAVDHHSITGVVDGIASNVWVVHDLNCTPQLCRCGVKSRGAATHGTGIYPKQRVSDRSLKVAKPGKSERPVAADGSTHPTVKPRALMQKLVEAFTAPDQVVLDPFLGSGTTMEAALLAGRRSVGCEMNAEFIPLIEQRLERCVIEK
jgi:site-specific DNA-methyltransferase (adenine-specific)